MNRRVVANTVMAFLLIGLVSVVGNAHTPAAPVLADTTTTITFDDLPIGSRVSNQYNAEGVNFEQGNFGLDVACYPAIEQLSPGQAQSGDQVADITCLNGDTGGSRAYGVLTNPAQNVSVYAGWFPITIQTAFGKRVSIRGGSSSSSEGVTLTTWDASGDVVGADTETVPSDQGTHTFLQVASGSANIVAFEVSSVDNDDGVDIDNLNFDNPGASFPDFAISPTSSLISVAPGSSTQDDIDIDRENGSAGGITFSASGLPDDVQASFSPNPSDGDGTTMTVSADAGAILPPPGAYASVTVTGTPDSSTAGSTAHSTTVDVDGSSSCPDVSTFDELSGDLSAGYKCVFVDDTATINFTQAAEDGAGGCIVYRGTPYYNQCYVLKVPDGVTIESDRSPAAAGGLLEMTCPTDPQETSGCPPATTGPLGQIELRAMLLLGSDDTISGLRIRGYDTRNTLKNSDNTAGVWTGPGQDILIRNNDISGWPKAGVDVGPPDTDPPASPPNSKDTAADIRVTGNFIHNNEGHDLGYGVALGNAYAHIDRNVFENDLTDIASTGQPAAGYVATQNFTLNPGYEDKFCNGGPCYGEHFDVHGYGPGSGTGHVGGTADGYTQVSDNTIRGAQSFHFLGRSTRLAFGVRGKPAIRAVFTDNAVAADQGSAIAITGVCGHLCNDAKKLRQEGKLVVSGNHYDVNTANELAVGKFGDDGCSDAFQATGASWWYSPCGSGEWRYLNQYHQRVSSLAFGDFNGNGKTDVFTQEGDKWLVSYGGTSPWTQLPVGSNIPMKGYRFGDFTGDGKTDVFRTNGHQWYISDAAATPWENTIDGVPLQTSSLGINQLRFGDFNGDGKTDVFSLANHQWSVSYGGTSSWRRLNSEISSDLSTLVFADFNGDGVTDVGRSHNGKWQVSWGATTPWRSLNTNSVPPMTSMLVGSFAGGKESDLLEYKDFYLGIPLPRERYNLYVGGAPPISPWSQNDMS